LPRFGVGGRYTDGMAGSPKRRFQFSLWTLFVVVTVTAAVAGAVRWLFVLTGGRVAIAVLVAFSIVMISVRGSSWVRRLWLKLERRRDAREQRRASETNRKLLELPDVKEAILAAKTAASRESDRPL
jgi:hypothetical protein